MKAVIYRKNGPPEVLTCEEIAKPEPKENEVLVRVHSAAVNPLDVHVMKGGPAIARALFGPRKPKTPGVDFAGVVEASGAAVTAFKPGDQVFGNCRGAFAEYAVAPVPKIVIKPENVSFDDAAACPVAALTALQGLRNHGKIQSGQQVLINGASGGVGTYAVQLAKYFGAQVTAVCSANNADLVRSLGADRIIDYTREDFTQDTERYDLVLDMAGSHPYVASKHILTPRGIWVGVGILAKSASLGAMLGGLIWTLAVSRFSRQKFVFFVAKTNREDLSFLAAQLVAGKLMSVIDRRYTLDETPEAIRYQGTWHARGKLIVNVAEP